MSAWQCFYLIKDACLLVFCILCATLSQSHMTVYNYSRKTCLDYICLMFSTIPDMQLLHSCVWEIIKTLWYL